MGVTNLWQILSPVQEHRSLSSLEGLVLAVDLSIWICESDGVKYMQGVVCKPYLRNLFFRILHLTQIGVKLVFVIDGTPPELKWEAMAKRQQARFPGRQGKQATVQKPPTKQSRKNFNAILKECCELLDMLGIPYIQSKGEAEALCALLNSSGLVDGCLTDDGDAFLYGAQTVYRNFTMNVKDPHVERYRYSDIESQLGIDRSGLVALGLLLGCDFIPKGVSGVGMANALKLLDCLKGRNVLERLKDWRRIHESQCLDAIEKMVRVKALSAPDFPQIDVINEFLQPKDRCPSRLSSWKRPVPVKLQNFALTKLDWPVEYTLEKILPLVTLWDMQDALQSRNPSYHQHLKPYRIVKTRIRQGVPCFEIEWFKPVTDPYHEGDYYATVENQEMFSKCYPTVVQSYFGETNSKNKKKKAKKKKAKEKATVKEEKAIENLSFDFGNLNIRKVTHKLQESLHDLHPSFTDYEESVLTTKVKLSNLVQTSNKTNMASDHCENSINLGKLKDVKPCQGFNSSNMESTDNTDIPFSDRIKLRLQQKRQNQVTNLVKNQPNDLSWAECGSSGKRKKKKNKSMKSVDNHMDSTGHYRGDSSTRCSSVNSPRSPFVGSPVITSADVMTGLPINRQVDSRKMSSPAFHTFCTPGSYIQQSMREDGDQMFRASPIHNHTEPGNDTHKTTSTNFKFFETPTRDSSPSVNFKATSNTTPGGNNLKSETTSTPTMLKGAWQTEYIENYFNELSKELSFNGNSNPQINEERSVSKQQNQNNCTPKDQHQASHPNSQSTSSFKIKPTQMMDDTHEMNFGEFELQSSLLNSLCASLIQTLTPKGMNKEQYDSLCESLKKIEQGSRNLDSDIKDIVTENAGCDIDLKEIEEVSSQLSRAFTPRMNMKSMNLDDDSIVGLTGQFKYDDNGSLHKGNGQSKSARRRLKKKQGKSMDISANDETVTKAFKVDSSSNRIFKLDYSNIHDRENSSGNTLKDSHFSENLPHSQEYHRKNNYTHSSTEGAHNTDLNMSSAKHRCPVITSKNNKVVNGQVLEDNGGNLVSQSHSTSHGLGHESTNTQENKKKRKNRKKKLRKASAEMNLSVDTSELDPAVYKNCSEYLMKALTQKPTTQSQTQKIEKASPLIDLSADDTFMELDVLSSCLSGGTASTNLEAKRKLALKKKLSKRKTGTDTLSTLNDETNMIDGEVICDSESSKSDPVLSINAAMSALSINPDLSTESDLVDRSGLIHKVWDDYTVSETSPTILDDNDLEDYLNGDLLNREKSKFGGEFENGTKEKVLSIKSNTSEKFGQIENETSVNSNDEENLAEIERDIMHAKTAIVSKCMKRREMKCFKRNTPSLPQPRSVCQRSTGMKAPDMWSRRQHWPGLEIGSGSSETEVYERNIQTCKDLTSWSQLPRKSVRDHQRVKGTNNSVRLNLGLDLHDMHRHNHRSEQSQTCATADNWIENYMRDIENGVIPTDGDVNHAKADRKYYNHELDIKHDTCTDIESEVLNITEVDNDSLDSVEIDSKVLERKEGEMDAFDSAENDIHMLNGAKSVIDEIERGTYIQEEAGNETLLCLYHDNGFDKQELIDTGSDSHLDHSDNEAVILTSDEEFTNPPISNGWLPNDNLSKPSSTTDTSPFIVSMGTSKPLSSSAGNEMTGPCIYISDMQFYTEDNESKVVGVNQLNESNEDIIEVDENGEEVFHEIESIAYSEACYATAKDINAMNGIVESLPSRSNGFVDEVEGYATAKDINATNGIVENLPSRSNGFINEVEGSSDKENEVIKLSKDLMVPNTAGHNMSVEVSKDDSSNGDKQTSVENSSSPIPLLDRLKMKFKKSSARSVLHSFTNGR